MRLHQRNPGEVETTFTTLFTSVWLIRRADVELCAHSSTRVLLHRAAAVCLRGGWIPKFLPQHFWTSFFGNGLMESHEILKVNVKSKKHWHCAFIFYENLKKITGYLTRKSEITKCYFATSLRYRQKSKEHFDRLTKAFHAVTVEKTGPNQRGATLITTTHFSLES